MDSKWVPIELGDDFRVEVRLDCEPETPWDELQGRARAALTARVADEKQATDLKLQTLVRSLTLGGEAGCACREGGWCIVHDYLLKQARSLAKSGRVVTPDDVERLWREFLSA